MSRPPFLVALELTKSCNLNCVHCRADADAALRPHELKTEEIKCLLKSLHAFGVKMVILTGGEALFRDDTMEIARYGHNLGLRMTLATNGALVTDEIAQEIKASGISRVSVSLDGIDAGMHDRFRGLDGAFNQALRGIELLKAADVPLQVNTTVAAMNISQMHDFPDFIKSIGAVAWHVFFLVPTGRGHTLESAKIDEYREMLDIFYDVYTSTDIECKATCAPQFYRLLKEKGHQVQTKGCLAGSGFGFISSTGDVQPCGFFDQPCGNVRQSDFSRIWNESKLLTMIRDEAQLEDACGACAYRKVCGGCRARAHEVIDSTMGTDPICWYAHG